MKNISNMGALKVYLLHPFLKKTIMSRNINSIPSIFQMIKEIELMQR